MKLITANKLNRFWQKGIKPIKNLLGNTDISKIGDGTVTGAINELNTGLVSNEVRNGVVNTNSVPDSSSTNVCYISLLAGIWVISSFVEFTESFNSIYVHSIFEDSTQAVLQRCNGAYGGGDVITYLVYTSVPITLYSRVYQDSGKTRILNSNLIKGVRLRPL